VVADWCDRQATIKTTGSVSASASIIRRLILVLMFIVLFKASFSFGSPPVTASDNREQNIRQPSGGKQNLERGDGYHITLRMDEARRLLRETKMSVVEVALDVGYADPSHFAQLFRRETGLSPSDYRRQR